VAFFGEPAYRARELRAFKNLLTKHDHIRSRMATEIKKKKHEQNIHKWLFLWRSKTTTQSAMITYQAHGRRRPFSFSPLYTIMAPPPAVKKLFIHSHSA